MPKKRSDRRLLPYVGPVSKKKNVEIRFFIPFIHFSIFSRVNATLEAAMLVGLLVGPSHF